MKLKQNPTLIKFNGLYNQIHEFYHEIALMQGLSDSAYSILQTILELGEGCTQTEIYKHINLNKQTVNSSTRKLKEDGLIQFQESLGREIRIFLTAEGKALAKEKICPIEEAESAVFDEMTVEEQAEILRLVKKYLDSFKEKVRQINV